MSVVVEQSIPYSSSALKLDDASRWQTLFPLLRPTVAAQNVSAGILLVDRAHASSNAPRTVVASGKAELSAPFLADGRVTAALVSNGGSGKLSPAEAAKGLADAGLDLKPGVVVVTLGEQRSIDVTEANGATVVFVTVDQPLDLNHAVLLLASLKPDSTDIAGVQKLLDSFLQTAQYTKTIFQKEKQDERPEVVHGAGKGEFQTAKAALERDLASIVEARDGTVYSVHVADINGLSQLENYILAHEIADFFDSQNIPHRTTSSTLTVATDGARGWAISAFAAPAGSLAPAPKPVNPLETKSSASTGSDAFSSPPHIKFDDATVRRRIVAGCRTLAAAEPTITKYDTEVGDGDCGYTLRDGANKVLEYVEGADLSRLPRVLAALVDDLEVTMGGTSGALYCIFLAALAQALQTSYSVPEALGHALEHLLRYTRARRGDRTCLDTLIPFVETLAATDNAERALEEADRGNEGTKRMAASLGRSAYLDESATQGVPDPGAYGLLKLLEGLTKG